MSDNIKTVLIDGGSPIAVQNGTENRFIYNLLPTGRFFDRRYGEINVTDNLVKQMQDNFGKFPAYKVPVKLGHEQGALSPGEVVSVQAKPEGLEITMNVDKDTSDAIFKKQYRYMSAEFDENYQDKTTGKDVGAVLLGAALVNQPANPYMAPLVLADDFNPKKRSNKNNMNEIDELKKQLSDATKELEELKAKKAEEQEKANKEVQKKLDDEIAKSEQMQKELANLRAEKEKAENDKNEAEVKAFCDKWTSKGVPPVVMDAVRPLLLSKTSRIIKLSDDTKDDVPSMKFFDDLFEKMPKVEMKQQSANGQHIELSDVEKAKERAKAIADSLGGNENVW